MNNRDRVLLVLNYREYDRIPVLHFGFWRETLQKWATEGHISFEDAKAWGDGNPTDALIGKKLGFDCNYYSCFHTYNRIHPQFESKILNIFPDGAMHVLNGDDNTGAIPDN